MDDESEASIGGEDRPEVDWGQDWEAEGANVLGFEKIPPRLQCAEVGAAGEAEVDSQQVGEAEDMSTLDTEAVRAVWQYLEWSAART